MMTLSVEKSRILEKLVRSLSDLMPYLHDEDVTEIMLNPNSEVWVDSFSKGSFAVGHLESQHAKNIIYTLAGLAGRVITEEDPFLETDLPSSLGLSGERINVIMPPVVARPTFTIRKHAKRVLTLEDYAKSNRVTPQQLAHIKNWLFERKNMLVVGSPGSGKTTVTNALIEAVCQENPSERFIILEDVSELKCSGRNQVPCLKNPSVSMGRLLISATRSKPDRILVGEVRGKDAYDMLLAWNIGCSGGIGTLHANGVRPALRRLIDLCYLAGHTLPPTDLICQTVQAIIFVEKRGSQSGFMSEIALLNGCRGDDFDLTYLLEDGTVCSTL